MKLVLALIERDQRAAELPRVLAVVEAARAAAALEPDDALAAVAGAVAAGRDLETAGRAALFEPAGEPQ